MSDLKKRTLSGIIYVIIYVFSVIYSENTFLILIATFSLIAIWEFNKLIDSKNIIPYLLLIFLVYYTQTSLVLNDNILFPLLAVIISSIQLIIFLYNKNSNPIQHSVNKVLLSIRYIVLPFVFLMLIPFKTGIYSHLLILFITVCIWVNDSFAYLVGKNIGKRKLFERISPKKTIEGFLGGLSFTAIVGSVFGYYFDILSVIDGLIIAVLVSFFGTFGDLVESKFKRIAKVKDSGTIMPGHGGILDRLDSLFFIAPFIYLYLFFVL